MEAVEDALEVIQWFSTAAYVVLAVITWRQWLARKDEPSRWMFLTFGTLGAISLVGRVLPEHSDWIVVEIVIVVLVAVLLLFPYFLYRLAASFTTGSPVMDGIALAMTAIIIIWSVAVGEFPEQGDPQPPAFRIFVLALVLDWVLLSSVVAIRFWRGGVGQPPVARRRMRALSVASLALSVAIVISGAAPERAPVVDLGIQTISIAAIFFFFFAFAPPRWLRAAWRRQSEESLRRAVIDLMGAITDESVVEGLLPHAVNIIGGEGVAILDTEGHVMASIGVEEGHWQTLARESNGSAVKGSAVTDLAPDLTKLDFPFGSMVVKTSPFTPFFGRDEIELLGALGVMANLALDRVRASEMKLQLAEAQIRRQQALEINDNIVQGLAVAKYALDLGETEKVQEAIDGTLAAARTIISDLLEEIGEDDLFGANALIRDQAATGFTRKEA